MAQRRKNVIWAANESLLFRKVARASARLPSAFTLTRAGKAYGARRVYVLDLEGRKKRWLW